MVLALNTVEEALLHYASRRTNLLGGSFPVIGSVKNFGNWKREKFRRGLHILDRGVARTGQTSKP